MKPFIGMLVQFTNEYGQNFPAMVTQVIADHHLGAAIFGATETHYAQSIAYLDAPEKGSLSPLGSLPIPKEPIAS